MDMDLHNLVKNNQHEEISKLDHPGLESFRAVAYIRMGDFVGALKCAQKKTFEKAYALYKLRKYKKALRILAGINTDGSRVLSSQCLYYLGYYNTAYKTLSTFRKDDDITVNLQAMKSLAILAEREKHSFRSKFCLRKMDDTAEFEDLKAYKMKSAEGLADFLFNMSFEHLCNENLFVGFLEDLVESPEGKFKGTMVEKQLLNIKGEFEGIDMSTLSSAQREVIEFNKGIIQEPKRALHFQRNFLKFDGEDRFSKHSERLWAEEIYKLDFAVDFKRIPLLSEKMVLLRTFVMCKNGMKRFPMSSKSAISSLQNPWLKAMFNILEAMVSRTEFSRVDYVEALKGVSTNISTDAQY